MQNFSCDTCSKTATFAIKRHVFVSDLTDADADAINIESHACAAHLGDYAPAELAARFSAEGKKKRGPREEKAAPTKAPKKKRG